MNDTRTMIVGQILISMMMAFLMTGFFSFLTFGLSLDFLQTWAEQFVISWPVAFCFSMLVNKFAFSLAAWITSRNADK